MDVWAECHPIKLQLAVSHWTNYEYRNMSVCLESDANLPETHNIIFIYFILFFSPTLSFKETQSCIQVRKTTPCSLFPLQVYSVALIQFQFSPDGVYLNVIFFHAKKVCTVDSYIWREVAVDIKVSSHIPWFPKMITPINSASATTTGWQSSII